MTKYEVLRINYALLSRVLSLKLRMKNKGITIKPKVAPAVEKTVYPKCFSLS